MAFKVFVAGAVFTAAEANTYFMEQSNIRCTSGTRPSSPAEGMTIVETDTDLLQMYSGSAWVEMGGYGAWKSWTPTVTQSGSVTVTVSYGKYTKIGRTIHAQCVLSVTGSGTANNVIVIGGLPVNAAGTNAPGIGGGLLTDSSVPSVATFTAELSSATGFVLFDTDAAGSLRLGLTGSAMPNGLASGDTIKAFITYEATS